jgi:hypothetical protein
MSNNKNSVNFTDPSLVTGLTSAAGDLILGNTSGLTNLPVGSNGQVLTVSGGLPSWATASGSTNNSVYVFNSAGGTLIGNFIATSGTFPTEFDAQYLIPAAGTLTALIIELDIAPGVGSFTSVFININGVGSSLFLTLSGSNKTSSTSASVAVSAGDKISVSPALTGGSSTNKIIATLVYSPS